MSLPDTFKITKLVRCGNCQELQADHVDGKCLFAPAEFREMTEEEWAAFYPMPLRTLYAGQWTYEGDDDAPE